MPDEEQWFAEVPGQSVRDAVVVVQASRVATSLPILAACLTSDSYLHFGHRLDGQAEISDVCGQRQVSSTLYDHNAHSRLPAEMRRLACSSLDSRLDCLLLSGPIGSCRVRVMGGPPSLSDGAVEHGMRSCRVSPMDPRPYRTSLIGAGRFRIGSDSSLVATHGVRTEHLAHSTRNGERDSVTRKATPQHIQNRLR